MDVSGNRITFWFGCNMLRHAEMIRLSIMLLERVGYDVERRRRTGLLLRHGARPSAARREQHGRAHRRPLQRGRREGGARHGRDVVPVLPHAHVRHHVAGQRGGVRDRAHHGAAGRPSRAPGAAADGAGEAARAAASASGICDARARQRPGRAICFRAFQACSSSQGPAHPGHMCSALAAVPGALAKAARETWDAAVAEALRHGLHDLPLLPPRVGGPGRQGRRACQELGASRRRGAWGSRPATPISAGARAALLTLPLSKGPTSRATMALVEPELAQAAPAVEAPLACLCVCERRRSD